MQRKRHHLKKKPSLDFFDKFMYLVAFLGPFLTFPQVLQIFSTHSATSVSLSSWLGYQALSLMWIIYGIRRRDEPLILAEGMWFIMQGLVILGVIIYH